MKKITWIYEHPSEWRIILLVLMVVAFLGPWGFERIHVPAKYPCSAPFIRLEGDFCGEPMSAIWLYPWVVISFFPSIVGLISGDLAFTRWVIGFLIFIPVLPIFSTLILILRGNHPGRQIFTIIAWGLAIAIVLLQWIDDLPQLFWILWGILLYIGVAISALILEILALMERRKLNQESAPAHHT